MIDAEAELRVECGRLEHDLYRHGHELRDWLGEANERHTACRYCGWVVRVTLTDAGAFVEQEGCNERCRVRYRRPKARAGWWTDYLDALA